MKLLSGLILLGTCLCAQSDRGTITGTVTDPAGAVVPGATVTATEITTNVASRTLTSSEGVYTIPYLRSGTYRVEAELRGFKKSARTGVTVDAAATVRADLQMELGTVTEQVEVQAAATQLRQDSAVVSQQMATQTILALPLSTQTIGRNPLSFAFLTPGVHGDAFDNFKVGGGSANGVEMLMDGLSVSHNTRNLQWEGLSPEAVAEFRVLTNAFEAEYGHTTGGLLSFVSKSGANAYHGSFYHFLRNNEFDARGAVARFPTVNRHNNFGATVGGPVKMPGLYDGKDRTFFFANYEGFRFRAGPPSSFSTLPTPAMQRGDFSGNLDARGALIPIYDPATTQSVGGRLVRTAFPTNTIPANRISRVGRNVVGFLPALTFPDRLTNNFANFGRTSRNIHQSAGRIDHSLSDAQRLSWSFTQRYRRTAPPQGPIPYPWPSGFTGDSQDSYYTRLVWDRVWRPNLVSQLSIGYNRNQLYEKAITLGEDWGGKLQIPNLVPLNVPTLQFSEYPQLGVEKDYQKYETTKLAAGSVSWVRGKHSLKFGADGRDKRMAARLFNDQVGTFTFRPTQTGLPGGGGGNSFASLLLGAVNNGFFRPAPYPVTGYPVPYFAAYIQDSWKATRRLTVNLGLRWDVTVPVTEDHGRMSHLDLGLPNPGAAGRPGGLVFYGSGPGRKGTKRPYDTSWNDFGPRLGVAFSLDDQTVIRAGYGLFFQPNQVPGLSNISAAGFFGNATFNTPDNGVSPAFQLDNGFPQDFLRAPFIDPTFLNGQGASTSFPHNGEPAYVNQWNFGIQRQFGRDFLMEATYAGSSAVGSISNKHNYNQAPSTRLSLGNLLLQNLSSDAARTAGIPTPYAGFSGTVAQALRPFPQFLNIGEFFEKDGHTTYHSLQVKAEKRMSEGLTFLLAYTWSKNLVNADYPLNGGTIFGFGFPQDNADARADKAISPTDLPHRLVLSWVWELPFGPGKRWAAGPLHHLAGGWQIAGVFAYQNDFPLRFTTNVPNQVFGGAIRPNVAPGAAFRAPVAGESFDPFRDRYIHTGFLTLPAAFTFGNAAFNYNYRGFASYSEDIALEKSFRFSEQWRLVLRGEAFNLLNRVRWGAPATNVSNANFGQISGQGNAARTLQVGAKLRW